ncbi:FAD-linked oxidase C-terminal domain-containing protein [Nitrosomonas mobilis]|uniref:Glycolate oxidase subunit, FAD-linked n=1 Tax=Nitrosomonas mobilis TaxID=51642 RepID=A0A1G5SEF2_9PROT|nr:FAD-linked oxidase C-terminal domain-containing protein [Nitrosomonas mobilis]SCZ85575.1 glycolate oxidase subunit, FAD-linked [Nitrosomonas mobilis]HNO76329.1 FAD-linked oxidase C-terminal domain-containing protein [Nitrosomonas mobilis]
MQRCELIRQLLAILPPDSVLYETEDLRPYECDALSVYRQLPLAVVLPCTEAEIIEILQLCHRERVPVVARGAGTGLSGGALPHAQGILLSLARLNQINEIDPLACQARVQPGVRNLAISQAASSYGLYYAPDPSSQIACTIGGNVAENSGGVHCLKYGLTVHNILKLRVLTIEGDVIEVGAEAYDSPGYDLLALLTGSEGMLGITTEITVRLLPKPESAQLVMATFSDLAKAGEAVANVIQSGIIPAGMELMDNLTIGAVEDFIQAGYDRQAAAILLCESDGMAAEVTTEIEKIEHILRASGAIKVEIAQDEAQRQLFWAGRKAAFPAAGRISPDYYCMDGTIPRKHLARVLSQIERLSAEFNLRCMNVFHAGDGNLHPLILYDANESGELHKAETFGARILEICIAAGGTITGEHGVGMEKLDQMCLQFSDAERELFLAIKAAFDPQALLNPGKAIPSLHRCAELGAMHVHHGQTSFPELPRF